MSKYKKIFEVIWSDIDPNRHMRHSVYNDYAAQTRVSLFKDYDFSLEKVARLGLGPILFREETRFFREINLSEIITVTCAIKSMHKNGSRWTFTHEIFKEDSTKAAQLTVDGAWLDLETRKLGTPSEEMMEAIYRFPRTDDFYWSDKNSP